ncbi:MAG TPA: NAD(P)/FAD-dependent oxidoreductase [Gemmatimonadaceae bacterium]|nr:NAD(P)/FAD-dependent oxidoreductase [Gemmatimonadaceae bacterium]
MTVVPPRDADVIVVGGGPAGASTAWSLAKDGIDVLVLDRAHFPRDKICAEYLSPQASRIFSDMGVLEEIEAAGAAHLEGMILRAPSGKTVHGEFAGVKGFPAFRNRGLAVRRTVLDEILLRRARDSGARVEEGVRVTDVTRDSGGRVTGVAIQRAGGEKSLLRGLIVVGADGLRSVVGRRLGLVRTRAWPRRIGLISHYRGISGMRGMGEMHVDEEGYLGLAEVGHGITNVGIVIPTSRAAKISGDREAFFASWIASRPHLAARFTGAEQVTPVRATGPFSSVARRAYVPGAALVGDAADFFDPFTGEGVYAALRGGEMLAPFVAEAIKANGDEGLRALEGYEAARRKEFGGKWKLERIVGMAIAFPPLINHAARALAARKDMADLLVGVAGDFVPAEAVLNPRFLFNLFLSPASRN